MVVNNKVTVPLGSVRMLFLITRAVDYLTQSWSISTLNSGWCW
jgi:hypothetical protein